MGRGRIRICGAGVWDVAKAVDVYTAHVDGVVTDIRCAKNVIIKDLFSSCLVDDIVTLLVEQNVTFSLTIVSSLTNTVERYSTLQHSTYEYLLRYILLYDRTLASISSITYYCYQVAKVQKLFQRHSN